MYYEGVDRAISGSCTQASSRARHVLYDACIVGHGYRHMGTLCEQQMAVFGLVLVEFPASKIYFLFSWSLLQHPICLDLREGITRLIWILFDEYGLGFIFAWRTQGELKRSNVYGHCSWQSVIGILIFDHSLPSHAWIVVQGSSHKSHSISSLIWWSSEVHCFPVVGILWEWNQIRIIKMYYILFKVSGVIGAVSKIVKTRRTMQFEINI